ncbi:hypothetical protein ABPG74_017651 [Tetrahymena malaccensis]
MGSSVKDQEISNKKQKARNSSSGANSNSNSSNYQSSKRDNHQDRSYSKDDSQSRQYNSNNGGSSSKNSNRNSSQQNYNQNSASNQGQNSEYSSGKSSSANSQRNSSQQGLQQLNQQQQSQQQQQQMLQNQMNSMGMMSQFQNSFGMMGMQPSQPLQLLNPSMIIPSGKKQKYDFLEFPPSSQHEFRAILLDYFLSDLFDYPMHSAELFENFIEAFSDIKDSSSFIKKLELIPLLQELNDKKAIKLETCAVGTKLFDFIVDINKDKIKQLSREFSKDRPKIMPILDKKPQPSSSKTNSSSSTAPPKQAISKREIEDLLKKETGLQKEVITQSKEKSNLLNKISAAEESALASFRKQGSRRIDYCDCGTRDKCIQIRNSTVPCNKAHFRKIIRPHTDENLGNCSYLDTCRHMDYCKFVHYELDVDINNMNNDNHLLDGMEKKLNPQWINCDLRQIDFNILGKFNCIMADPPWDIHMTLPYGTLKDREMKAMRVDLLQDEGVIFLWVTGRAMELGRECLTNWGYRRVEEIIWVKTNQLQRIIRTGRTGHWLNHSKEHCLVGIKGNPKINRKIDCDVIVSEVRETSRKPDEIYNLIERMCPGGKKIELFGRPHNTMPGWLTLGNQLPGIYLEDEEIIERYMDAYPDQDISRETMERNRIRMKNENDIDHIYNSHIQNIPPFKTKQLTKDLQLQQQSSNMQTSQQQNSSQMMPQMQQQQSSQSINSNTDLQMHGNGLYEE